METIQSMCVIWSIEASILNVCCFVVDCVVAIDFAEQCQLRQASQCVSVCKDERGSKREKKHLSQKQRVLRRNESSHNSRWKMCIDWDASLVPWQCVLICCTLILHILVVSTLGVVQLNFHHSLKNWNFQYHSSFFPSSSAVVTYRLVGCQPNQYIWISINRHT